MKRHYQSECHLRQDQRYHEWFFSDALRGKVARILFGARLADEGEIYIDLEVTEMGHRRRFFYNVVEEKPFMCTSEDDCVMIQLQLLMTSLRRDGQL